MQKEIQVRLEFCRTSPAFSPKLTCFKGPIARCRTLCPETRLGSTAVPETLLNVQRDSWVLAFSLSRGRYEKRQKKIANFYVFEARLNRLASFTQYHKGIIPTIPNEQSIIRQPQGIPRTSPAISANGIMDTQAMMPACKTQIFFIGSRSGPMKKMAIPRGANASQSVP